MPGDADERQHAHPHQWPVAVVEHRRAVRSDGRCSHQWDREPSRHQDRARGNHDRHDGQPPSP